MNNQVGHASGINQIETDSSSLTVELDRNQ